ncbi:MULTISPECIES: 50S ribosomal protein L3 N(5)-glutamine methyltransferase [Caballeronia]|jgi:ribosomal protein L3 glutamine methyltransferase|uniref:Ribosomal protein uL3 glutamine methyltransferase n=1 Tax=Caballeronia zhejiangensis TaxID=871203 RepID=A0A656QIA7_9BURK|nr:MULTISPECIES: 50S ribosomal protein L3 N(5)-glutamine methyltransferase [Caballeronia]EKS68020.1 N5-glutamine S-adenosyl-L-methionine-dependent methyltransferase [Burkholderia sp. SJ98]KDR29851.1 SAM-dependent methyltransferase [Caballeronia zhejiangensis]MCG7401469.1 50S ribosomal protein L3 N(5)-glutamine methyltransferase [Caballeronia zhejiangensis]MCI1042988.1 50S ribosomal protein L3 N(5)-glutamine methyltransferase [Caballeronia zhejiangensis]MDR5787558.1 50S ribosomal protein L3 N(5
MALPFTTVRDLLRFGVSRFTEAGLSFGHGSSNAYDEAAYLILHTLHLPLDTLDPFLDARLLDHEIDAVMKVIERRAKERIPAAYITQEAWMHGRRFYVDERVIVPRSFIGELLQDGLQPYVADPDQVTRVLELCTGSGCLAILAAQAFENADVDAVDISADALAVARRNVDDYGLEERVSLYEGDLYAPLPEARYEVIITNPPYVNADAMQALPAEYRHEPELALAGGADGMDVVRRIVRDAGKWLTEDGVLVVEIGNERPNVEAALGGLDLVWLSTSAGDDNVFLIQAADLPA